MNRFNQLCDALNEAVVAVSAVVFAGVILLTAVGIVLKTCQFLFGAAP